LKNQINRGAPIKLQPPPPPPPPLTRGSPSEESDGEHFQDLEESESLREKLRRNMVNIGIILLALVLIFFMRTFLLKHFFPASAIGESLATLEYLFNEVVQRNAGEAGFQNASLDQVLYENDAIRTYEQSHAELLFKDGSKVRIDENTLVILKRIRDGWLFGENLYALYLENGGTILELNPFDKIYQIIKSPYGEIKIRAEAGSLGLKLKIELLPDGSARISSYSGNGVVTINGEEFLLNPNQYIFIGEDLKASVRMLERSKVLILPQEDPSVFTQKVGQEVTFEWATPQAAAHYGFLLARDEGFENIVSKSISNNTYYTDQIIGAGRYYWRVQKLTIIPPPPENPDLPPTIETDPNIIAEGTFLIVFDDPSAWDKVLIDPQRNIIDDKNRKTTVFFQADYPLVTFSWKRQKRAKSYRLEIFLDENFEELEMAKDLIQDFYSTKPGFFKHTQYFWQVISFNTAGDPIHVSDVFELKLYYDNALPYLSIFEPEEDQVFTTDTIALSGIIPKEAKLFIEGKEVKVEARGKFSHSVPIPMGTSQIIFKAVGEETRIEYHARTITRK